MAARVLPVVATKATGNRRRIQEGGHERTGPAVASDIEDAYAEIGRSVVIRAIEQAISAGVAASGEAENAVTIRLLLEPGKEGSTNGTPDLHLHARYRRDLDVRWSRLLFGTSALTVRRQRKRTQRVTT